MPICATEKRGYGKSRESVIPRYGGGSGLFDLPVEYRDNNNNNKLIVIIIIIMNHDHGSVTMKAKRTMTVGQHD